MRGLRAIVMGIISSFILLGAGGCQSTEVGRAKINRSVQITQEDLPSEQLKDKLGKKNSNTSVENLITTSENYIEYIWFQKKDYAKDEEVIINDLSNGEFSDADRGVKKLIDKLKHDQNRYSQEYLKLWKDFSYIKIEAYDLEERKIKENTDLGCLLLYSTISPATIPIDTLGAVVGGVSGKSYESMTNAFIVEPCTSREILDRKYLGKYFSLIRITPSTREKEKIAENVPYEELEAVLQEHLREGGQR